MNLFDNTGNLQRLTLEFNPNSGSDVVIRGAMEGDHYQHLANTFPQFVAGEDVTHYQLVLELENVRLQGASSSTNFGQSVPTTEFDLRASALKLTHAADDQSEQGDREEAPRSDEPSNAKLVEELRAQVAKLEASNAENVNATTERDALKQQVEELSEANRKLNDENRELADQRQTLEKDLEEATAPPTETTDNTDQSNQSGNG